MYLYNIDTTIILYEWNVITLTISTQPMKYTYNYAYKVRIKF